MKGFKRTNYCGEIKENMIGKEVTLMGWVSRKRVFSHFSFILLRDRTGIVQAVVNQDTNSEEVIKKDKELKPEYVVAIKGKVVARTEENINPDMETGKVEVLIDEMEILSESETPPFQIEDSVNVSTDLRLKYRYLDLRRPSVAKNLILRHNIAQSVRRFLDNEGFLEIETPFLTKSTPEGARDYLVPSRVHPGEFYALPQSPQIFKQLLMASGFDKYFQIVKCFRDEDLRADRQPEFTQVDMELSFIYEEEIMSLNERLMQTILKETKGIDIQIPFERMPYKEAMEKFGSDKPDIRFGMELTNITNLVAGSDFGVFENAITSGGSVRGINAKGACSMPRKQIDSLVELAKTYRAKGLAWLGLNEDGTFKTSIGKFFDDNKLKEIAEAFGAEKGDLILICADKDNIVFDALGALRLEMAKRLELTNKDDYRFLWVTEFPLFEYDEEEKRYVAKHHPFTMPMEEDIDLLETNPEKARAIAYDLVLNGYELGGGSLRIYQSKLQEKMFKCLGFTKEDANERFGFLIDAFKYGAPPHGGLALGLDRIVMLLSGSDSLRDVIAFPKVKDASCPLADAPNFVDKKQLEELMIDIKKIEE
ncbi:aspartate--tRNA ligase [[Clostridium] colinum]|uniref:aspartate--tRNA ligase n=1 Tax=[Clostridium] colinum TaxID=36835 RepID=UPI0020240B70|nr:aspartate--tRNA ligase [[Clostridium] colinum]